MEWTRIKHDVNGNPRYVCHYHNLLTDDELNASMWDYQGRLIHPTKYEIALQRAHKLGGRKFNNKQYGGGIVFSTYALSKLENHIQELKGK